MGRPAFRGLLRRGVPGLGWSPPSAWLQRDPRTHLGPDCPGSSLGSLWAAPALLRLALTPLALALLSPDRGYHLSHHPTSEQGSRSPHPSSAGSRDPAHPTFPRQSHKATRGVSPLQRVFPISRSCRILLSSHPPAGAHFKPIASQPP